MLGGNYMANKKKSRQLKWEDRIRLEALERVHTPRTEIAQILGVHRSTIYNELKRGRYIHTNSDYTEEERYSPEIAQEKCEENLKMRGTQLKIGNDIEYANYLEHKICVEKYSPEAVLEELKITGKEEQFKTKVCKTTVYSYIEKGVFLTLRKEQEKRGYHKVQRQKRVSAGPSIKERPEEIDTREVFGHWEMDTVVGPQGKSKHSILVLSERKTRNEIIMRMKSHTAAEVVKCLNKLEEYWGEDFSKVFKSITVDNGKEFSDYEGIKSSILEEGRNRVEVYYCHAYSSWERGTNENLNRMIRRFIPKGTNFDDYPDEVFDKIQNWMNNYPRRMFGFHSSGELFEEELRKVC